MARIVTRTCELSNEKPTTVRDFVRLRVLGALTGVLVCTSRGFKHNIHRSNVPGLCRFRGGFYVRKAIRPLMGCTFLLIGIFVSFLSRAAIRSNRQLKRQVSGRCANRFRRVACARRQTAWHLCLRTFADLMKGATVWRAWHKASSLPLKIHEGHARRQKGHPQPEQIALIRR